MSKTNRPTIDLSPEARAALKLPLRMEKGDVVNADGKVIAKCFITHEPRYVDYEVATFFANLGNAALTPESNTELAQQVADQLEACQPGVPMCHIPDCLNGAEPGYIYCTTHMHRWTFEETLQREG